MFRANASKRVGPSDFLSTDYVLFVEHSGTRRSTSSRAVHKLYRLLLPPPPHIENIVNKTSSKVQCAYAHALITGHRVGDFFLALLLIKRNFEREKTNCHFEINTLVIPHSRPLQNVVGS